MRNPHDSGVFASQACADHVLYGDDVLYSLRLRRAGLGMVFMPAVRPDHDCGTMGQGFIYRPLWKIYHHCRNGVSIARQAAGPIIFPAALLTISPCGGDVGAITRQMSASFTAK